MIIFVDIDETICYTPKDPDGKNPPVSRDYSLSTPFPERIKTINLLYDEGNTIVYWTARGTTTGGDWRELTEKQFEEWGVKYHRLFLGKPAGDIYVDDKGARDTEFFDMMREGRDE